MCGLLQQQIAFELPFGAGLIGMIRCDEMDLCPAVPSGACAACQSYSEPRLIGMFAFRCLDKPVGGARRPADQPQHGSTCQWLRE